MIPIKLGKTEVISLDFEKRIIGLLIHHSYDEEERKSSEAIGEFAVQKKNAVSYLVREGFIPGTEISFWKCSISGIYHPPEESTYD